MVKSADLCGELQGGVDGALLEVDGDGDQDLHLGLRSQPQEVVVVPCVIERQFICSSYQVNETK